MEYSHSPSAWQGRADTREIFSYCDGYKKFLNGAKTEREAAALIALQADGFCDLDDLLRRGAPMPGSGRVIVRNRGKMAALFVAGKRPLSEGIRFVITHIDSPRLDVRPKPLYDDGALTLLKTHYYGGLKKYQWVAQPLALHGVIVRRDGTAVPVCLGESEDEPVFYISDLPRHLSAKQLEQPMESGISGEDLNVVFGSVPDGDGSARGRILALLQEKYQVSEQDLISAELEIVPAGKARDVGLDSSLICAYGQDDRSCAYAALRAVCSLEAPEYACCAVFADKEEVGSPGNTGMNSRFLEHLAAKLLHLTGGGSYYDVSLCLEHSKAISGDVGVGFDPSHSDVFLAQMSAYLGHGPLIMKYSGHRGKNGTNDAHAEYVAKLRGILDSGGIPWQISEMGRLDAGGGGTIAPFASSFGMEIIELGIALLSMHAPYELSSKVDLYDLFRAYRAFFSAPQ